MKIPFLDHHILLFLKKAELSSLPLDLTLQAYFRTHKSLGSKDRKTMGDIVFGMFRWKSLLDEIGGSLEKKLQFYKNFEKGTQLPPTISKHARIGTSKFLYEKFLSQFGNKKGEELLSLLNTTAPLTIRVNSLKTTREEMLEKWKNTFQVSPCKLSPLGIQFSKREPLFSLSEFKEGFFEVQDEASQLVAQEVDAKPKDLVLDYCSGSGGKTLAFAPKMEGQGQIFLHDTRKGALLRAKTRLRRAGIQNAQFLSKDHVQLSKLEKKCHWVLIDVPCSGTGTLRRNPDQKWRLNESVLNELIQEQRAIAKEAVSFLHPQGKLVYATCSLLKEENEEQVEFFLKQLPLELISSTTHLPAARGGDGFFSAVFRKKDPCYDQA